MRGDRTQVVQVHAGTKGFARAGDDQHMCLRFLDCRQCRQQFIDQFVGDCVAFVRAVEGNRGRPVIVIEQKSIEVHVYSSQ